MKIWMVGGAVRDRLLGLPAGDRDWVVVGATPETMVAQGYVPVGRDFPVFLHPRTHEEYALARTERKTALGYHGFSFYHAPDVTLEEDLARRDLTINAMAQDDAGQLVDPYGGQRDLAQRVLRHVGPAFEEDPVRILRLARFAARFGDFSVAPETLALCRSMVQRGEVDALVAERVWQELQRGLMNPYPSRMLQVLGEAQALPVILPELASVVDAQGYLRPQVGCLLDALAALGPQPPSDLATRWTALLGGCKADTAQQLMQRLRVPGEVQWQSLMLLKEQPGLNTLDAQDAGAVLSLLEQNDGWRRPERLDKAVAAGLLLRRVSAGCAGDGAAGQPDHTPATLARFRRLHAAGLAVQPSEVLARHAAGHPGKPPPKGPEVGALVRAARLAAMRQADGGG